MALSRIGLLALVFAVGCASAKKRKDAPELSELEGKKVALVQVEGHKTGRQIAEVALINQLVKRGTFVLINKKEVEQARAAHDVDPRDWRKVASRAGADVALSVDVQRFSAKTREGYSREKVYDSQLAEELGEDKGDTERLYKVKALEGAVRFELRFTTLKTNQTRKGIAQWSETVKKDERAAAIRLPPRLRFLEKLSNKAFHDFFERYN